MKEGGSLGYLISESIITKSKKLPPIYSLGIGLNIGSENLDESFEHCHEIKTLDKFL